MRTIITFFSYIETAYLKGNKMENLIKKHIRFNDIWLLIYFLIHVIYIVLCIFFPVPKENEKSVLDVVMRTSATVLIGYFLRKSFVSNKSPITSDEGKRIRIRVQSDVIGAIGLFCLCVFGIVRFISSIVMPYYIMSQLRDFYLASTAFLMGTAR